LLGVRQQRVQFFYDTDFLVNGAVTSGDNLARSQKQLFASASIGDLTRSNMPSPGYLSGDQTFLTYAVRHEVGFYSGVSTVTGATTTAEVMWLTLHCSTFRYQVGEKVEFEGPVTMSPAGGGPFGFVSDSAQPLITNGVPENKAIYVLPLPIAVTKRQGIRVEEFKNALSAGTSGGTSIDPVAVINSYTGYRVFRCYIDGFNTRDVQ
jgi:hypothetical protein